MSKNQIIILRKIYKKLFQFFGPQHWWPGNSRLEIIVGAILTQNTNWNNVEKAIKNLKFKKKLSVRALREIPEHKLARIIVPAGFFNVKAKRLKNFIVFISEEYAGSIKKMSQEPLNVLRQKLLTINGIGPETADSILLYACDKPIFVIDAYTKRILCRHNLIEETDVYNDIQKIFMTSLKKDVKIFNEYHALIVKLAKEFCRTKPLCSDCPLKNF